MNDAWSAHLGEQEKLNKHLAQGKMSERDWVNKYDHHEQQIAGYRKKLTGKPDLSIADEYRFKREGE
jgi:hypothetical protein